MADCRCNEYKLWGLLDQNQFNKIAAAAAKYIAQDILEKCISLEVSILAKVLPAQDQWSLHEQRLTIARSKKITYVAHENASKHSAGSCDNTWEGARKLP